MSSAIQSPLLSREEAAVYLGVKPQTLSVWAMTGRHLPVVKFGRLSRYRKTDLDKFIERSTRGTDLNF